jgi:hypothetical protein
MRSLVLLIFGLITSFCTNTQKTEYEFYSDGSIKCKYSYLNNILEGKYACYYENGKIMEEGHYENNKKNGQVISYHPNGLTKSVYTFQEGIENGDYKVFYPNGNLKIVGQMEKGKKMGSQIEYKDGREPIKKAIAYFINYQGQEVIESITKFDNLGNRIEYKSETDYRIIKINEEECMEITPQSLDLKDIEFIAFIGCFDSEFTIINESCIDTLNSEKYRICIPVQYAQESKIRGIIEFKSVSPKTIKNDTTSWTEDIIQIPFEKIIDF